MSKLLRLALSVLVFAAVATPAEGANRPSTPPEHLVPVPKQAGHRITLSDQLLAGQKLALAKESGRKARAVRPALGGSTTAETAPSSTASSTTAGVAPFLTRPYWNHHDVTSIFDHCNPDYSVDGKLCEVDGTVALASNGSDPSFAKGYAITPGSTNYLYYDGHNGWDIGLDYETLIAAAPGTVTIAGVDPNNTGFGLCVVIDHGNGFSTRYGHMSQIAVSAGQRVNRGQYLGVSGNTGLSTGPHLHFGLYTNSPWEAIDPWGWAASTADPWPYDKGDLWLTGNPENPIPTAPSNVSASVVDNEAVVHWSAPSFNGGDLLTSYRITASPGGASATVPASQTTGVVTGLTYGLSYTFSITAANDVGWGPGSAASNAVTPIMASLGGKWSSSPVAASWGGGRTDLFGVGADQSLLHGWVDSSGFHGWESLGGKLAAQPAAVSWGSNRLDVFVRGTDNALWHIAWDGTRWYPWESLGGILASAPSANAWGSNRLDIVVLGTDGGLWHRWWDGSQWRGWESLGGNPAPDSTAHLTSWGNNRLDVFIRDAAGAVWHRAWTGTSWTWTRWENLGGIVTSELGVDSRPGVLEVFGVGSDSHLWHRWWAGSWVSWSSFGGQLVSAPLVVETSNRIDVVGIGTDSAAWHLAFNGQWSGWMGVGGHYLGAPSGSEPASGLTWVFGLGTDNAVWEANLRY